METGEDRRGRPRLGRERLTREWILRAALRVADEEGIGALSMRRLAAELGVDPMAIYHHVPGKGAVLAGMVELVYGEMRASAATGAAWQDLVRENARTLREVTRAHPNLVLHLVSNPEAGAAAALEANEALFGALVAAGFPPRVVLRAADLVVDYVNGFALGEAGGTLGGPGERDWFRALLEAQPTDKYPALRCVYDGVTEEESRSDFEYGLDVILAGLEAARAGQESAPGR
ncbi:MAG: TetR/AcrR family transcriptional regulator C-terminal domain-containing protein [Actinomycetota bacterium]|nr:TetR/AcrR family transcriptional regulator C-terminal domain-containing protein [Actinomycetota bacterium]